MALTTNPPSKQILVTALNYDYEYGEVKEMTVAVDVDDIIQIIEPDSDEDFGCIIWNRVYKKYMSTITIKESKQSILDRINALKDNEASGII